MEYNAARDPGALSFSSLDFKILSSGSIPREAQIVLFATSSGLVTLSALEIQNVFSTSPSFLGCFPKAKEHLTEQARAGDGVNVVSPLSGHGTLVAPLDHQEMLQLQ
jgi:hypothetical protein